MKTTPLMQSNIAAQARRVSALTRRGTRGKRRLGDIIFRNFTLLFVLITLALVVGVAWILVSYSLPTITAFGFSFLTNQAFDPVHNVFGVAPAIFGTLVTSCFAIIFAVPIGIGAAIFLVEFCPLALRSMLAFVMELLVAIPSVVIGLWGFLVLASWLNSSGEPWLQSHLGFLPFFRGQPHGLGLLAAGIVLVIMILPLIISVSREVMLTVPQSQREALLALGATLGGDPSCGPASLARRHHGRHHPGAWPRARRDDGGDNGDREPGHETEREPLRHGLYAFQRHRQPVWRGHAGTFPLGAA